MAGEIGMTNYEIYAQGYAISVDQRDGVRAFQHQADMITVPAHHIMIELLDGREVCDINRVREVAQLYETERV